MKQLNVQTTKPTAYITVNKNRLKNYGNKIYLKNNTNFEIELFNPLTKKVLVKIEINGITISSSGLILNPGQRGYLERWIDNNKKFLFQTYDVENTEEAKTAISENGKVKISFYEEQTKNLIFYDLYPSRWWDYRPFYEYIPTSYVYETSNNIITSSNQNNINYTSDTSMNFINFSSFKDKIETGRIEMGEKSNQEFETAFGDFNSCAIEVVEWQIISDSKKPIEISKIRRYCSNCKKRIRRDSWKFCPSCGEKL